MELYLEYLKMDLATIKKDKKYLNYKKNMRETAQKMKGHR